MHDRPSPPELAAAVREFLQAEILPVLADPRLRFRALVAVNGLGILERELTLPGTDERERLHRLLGSGRESTAGLNRELAARIRAGEPPPGTLEHLRETAREKLAVASPGYLERYR